MKINSVRYALSAIAISVVSFGAQAAAIVIEFSALIEGGTDPTDNVTGTYIAAGISNGDTITGTFIFEDDAANASSSNISANISEFEFTGSPYGVSINLDSGYIFNSDPQITVEVQNNKFIDGTGVNGHVASGTYDVVGLFGLIGIEEEWTINILADTDWFTDALDIPDTLPVTYDVFLQADDYDSSGTNSLGTVLASFNKDSVSVSVIPIPASVWLFGAGLVSLLGIIRRKYA